MTAFVHRSYFISFICLLTHRLLELFPKNPFLGHFGDFRLAIGQISFNLVKRHLQHDSLPFFPLTSRVTTFWLGHAQKSQFWVENVENVTYVFRLFDFFLIFFLAFTFSSFLFFNLLLGLLTVKKLCWQLHSAICRLQLKINEQITQPKTRNPKHTIKNGEEARLKLQTAARLA